MHPPPMVPRPIVVGHLCEIMQKTNGYVKHGLPAIVGDISDYEEGDT